MLSSNNRMGRPPLNVKPVIVRLPEDIPGRIDAIVGKQKRAAFIREAVENELKRRETTASRDGQSST
jgi:metal-responsive CopG/Arc/MetJ family transcriptional regulator